MRKTLMTAAAAFVAGGIVAGAALSVAQPAPGAPPAGPVGRPHPGMMQNQGHPGWMQGPGHPGMMGWGHGPGAMRGRFGEMRKFALIFRAPDRNLSPADVQKIAEAFLLWNGNHTWKVTGVAASTDGQIVFNLATPDGSVIAKFSMDPHNGHVKRLG